MFKCSWGGYAEEMISAVYVSSLVDHICQMLLKNVYDQMDIYRTKLIPQLHYRFVFCRCLTFLSVMFFFLSRHWPHTIFSFSLLSCSLCLTFSVCQKRCQNLALLESLSLYFPLAIYTLQSSLLFWDLYTKQYIIYNLNIVYNSK